MARTNPSPGLPILKNVYLFTISYLFIVFIYFIYYQFLSMTGVTQKA